MFHFISAQPLMTSKHDRLHSSKTTTAGTCIGPMPLPQWRDNIETWHLTFKEKKAIYGDARMLPHCRPDGDQDLVGTGASRVMQVRKDSDSEPVTYNALHRNVIEELTHQIGGRGKVRAIVDLTPTEPTTAMMAMEWQIPYLGVCYNEKHKELIKKRLAEMVFRAMQTPKSSLYDADLEALITTKKRQDSSHCTGTTKTPTHKYHYFRRDVLLFFLSVGC